MTIRFRMLTGIILSLSLVLVSPASAHHALGGAAPRTFIEGLMSGLAHPLINFDHLAFVIAIGVLTAVGQASKYLPVWFVAGSILGTVLAVNAIIVPYAGVLAHLMLLGLGLALVFGHKRLRLADIIAFSLAGVLHGAVYAEVVLGTVSTSLSGYLIGFALIQAAIAMAAWLAAYLLWAGDRLYANARVVGGVVFGIGLTILAQSLMSTSLTQL